VGDDWLAAQFESHRGHLRAVAYRMLAPGRPSAGEPRAPAPRGRLLLVMPSTVENGKIVALDVVAGRERLRDLRLGLPPEADEASA
jgi:hypothetical protein